MADHAALLTNQSERSKATEQTKNKATQSNQTKPNKPKNIQPTKQNNNINKTNQTNQTNPKETKQTTNKQQSNQTKPSQAKPSQTKPTQTNPTQPTNQPSNFPAVLCNDLQKLHTTRAVLDVPSSSGDGTTAPRCVASYGWWATSVVGHKLPQYIQAVPTMSLGVPSWFQFDDQP